MTDLEKQRIREIVWRAVKPLEIDINDKKVIEEGLYRAFTNEAQGGETGADGKSAYELAVEEGFQGTLDEWLDSLKGEPGQNGADGAPGAPGQDGENGENAEIVGCTATVDSTSGSPKVTVTMGGTSTQRTFQFDFTGLVGAQGATGAQGPAGVDGNDGQDGVDGAAAGFGKPIANVNTLEPGQQATVNVVATGDNTNKIFTFTFGIPKGEKGDTGATGAAGAAATITGATASVDNTVGIPQVEVTAEGTASARSFNFAFKGIKGEKGEKGDKGDDGTSVSIKSSAAECNNAGDGYIDENGHLQIWNGESFVDAGEIKGPKGDKGDTGEIGPQGPAGTNGEDGEDGKTPIFEAGTATSVDSTVQPSIQIISNGTDDNGNPKYLVNVSIPKGEQGKQGIQGQQGIQGEKGETGPAGADGATGEKGDVGDAAGFGTPIATANTLNAGSNATVQVTASGEDTAKVFNFTFGIPKGDKGEKGEKGEKGDTGETGANGQDGAPGRDGQDGAPGTDGENGKTPVFEIGEVTTLIAGSSATCTIVQNGVDESGNPKYKINIGIPRGETGAAGQDGEPGQDGADGAPGATGATPNITINATVDDNVGIPSVTVTESGTTENPIFNFQFSNLKGTDGLDGEDATINITQQMPGKVIFFPDSHDNTFRPTFNINNASNNYVHNGISQLRFSPGDCCIDGDGKIWTVQSVSSEGMVATCQNDPAMQISLVTQ